MIKLILVYYFSLMWCQLFFIVFYLFNTFLCFVSENVYFLWVTTGKYRRCHRCVMNFILNSTAHKIGTYCDMCRIVMTIFKRFILLEVFSNVNRIVNDLVLFNRIVTVWIYNIKFINELTFYRVWLEMYLEMWHIVMNSFVYYKNCFYINCQIQPHSYVCCLLLLLLLFGVRE